MDNALELHVNKIIICHKVNFMYVSNPKSQLDRDEGTMKKSLKIANEDTGRQCVCKVLKHASSLGRTMQVKKVVGYHTLQDTAYMKHGSKC